MDSRFPHFFGSVAGTTTTRHPVAAARAVMEHSPHVMLSGAGADEFARDDQTWRAYRQLLDR